MRRSTIKLITYYITAGAVFNVLSIIYIFSLHINLTEAIITIAAANACYIVVARDISKAHEYKCSAKKIMRKTPGVRSRR